MCLLSMRMLFLFRLSISIHWIGSHYQIHWIKRMIRTPALKLLEVLTWKVHFWIGLTDYLLVLVKWVYGLFEIRFKGLCTRLVRCLNIIFTYIIFISHKCAVRVLEKDECDERERWEKRNVQSLPHVLDLPFPISTPWIICPDRWFLCGLDTIL